jgi:hypothetical protein
MADHYTEEGTGFVDATGPDPIAEARKRHHLASADPERDGTLTGPAHEEKYGLDRAADSAALWRGVGVHPIENRALVEGEDGAENLRGVGSLETTRASTPTENTASKKA